jgi:uncharacterized protein (TIGR03083 family)
MRYLHPIRTEELFLEERSALLQLLDALPVEQWANPTACPGWSVHDVALHLLGDDIGIISVRRDGYKEPRALANLDISQWVNLVAFINQRNEQWVQATQRISPRLLCEFLQMTGEAISRHFAQLDQFALGVPVHWAGPDPAPVWLDTAREYTERWVHQQHIRDAVGEPGLKERRWLAPVLEAFVYALPQTLREVKSPLGTTVQLVITGDAGDAWSAVRTDQAWVLSVEATREPDARVMMDQDIAWRLFTKGLSRAEALPHIRQDGNKVLADKVLDMVSIIA